MPIYYQLRPAATTPDASGVGFPRTRSRRKTRTLEHEAVKKPFKIIPLTSCKQNEVGYARRMSQENAKSRQPLIRPINRQQMSWRAVDVERLVGEDHRARAIWTLVGRLDLRRFY
jgi:hypothetical protein